MSDYMFMLESHLGPDQFRVVTQMRQLAGEAGVNLYLTGGAMRDMLGGFPVRDLDFTVETNATKLAKVVEKKLGATIVSQDDLRKSVEMVFPGGVTAELAMARQERFPKPGGKPQITAAGIHEDLRCRDFTVNAIALSLNRGSLGLPIDPTNGIGDMERKELRAIHNYSFYDDPVRMLSLMRFKVRLGYAIDERTRLQYENAREAEMLQKISPEALGTELRRMAMEPNIGDLVQTLSDEKLIELYSPALTGAKLNIALLQKLQKARQMVPHGVEFALDALPLLLHSLLDKLNPKERAAFLKNTALEKSEITAYQKLDGAGKKLEKELKGAKLVKASLLYQAMKKAPGEAILYLALHSGQRIVQDRIKNYFGKYLPMSLEISDEDVLAANESLAPGTPKFEKAKEAAILKHLDARPKKVIVPEPPPPPPPTSAFGRGPAVRQARS
jgi:tRNA nucleotidyltransferase/poly(A) polymerase